MFREKMELASCIFHRKQPHIQPTDQYSDTNFSTTSPRKYNTMSESKQETIDRVKASLPLPDDPVGGATPDHNSLDERLVNVDPGGVNLKMGTGSKNGLDGGPATQVSDVRQAGGGFKSGIPPRNENTDMPMADKEVLGQVDSKKDPNDITGD
jgi:hypothetical protein